MFLKKMYIGGRKKIVGKYKFITTKVSWKTAYSGNMVNNGLNSGIYLWTAFIKVHFSTLLKKGKRKIILD